MEETSLFRKFETEGGSLEERKEDESVCTQSFMQILSKHQIF